MGFCGTVFSDKPIVGWFRKQKIPKTLLTGPIFLKTQKGYLLFFAEIGFLVKMAKISCLQGYGRIAKLAVSKSLCHPIYTYTILVGGFNNLEKCSSMGRIIPYIMENK